MGITRRYKDTTLEHELTKPCPLMPDGKWHKVEIHIKAVDAPVVADGTGSVKMWFVAEENTPLRIKYSTTYYDFSTHSTEETAYTIAYGSSNKNHYLDLDSTVGCFGEVRYQLEFSKLGETSFSTQLQSANAWYVNNLSQQYGLFNVSSIQSNQMAIILALQDLETEIVVNAYAYVVPNRFLNLNN